STYQSNAGSGSVLRFSNWWNRVVPSRSMAVRMPPSIRFCRYHVSLCMAILTRGPDLPQRWARPRPGPGKARGATKAALGKAHTTRPPSLAVDGRYCRTSLGTVQNGKVLSGKRGGATMDLHLEGKRALVTGSTAGIGRAAAECLGREGATVSRQSRKSPT